MLEESEQQLFTIPPKLFSDLYEFTGSADKNKGYILLYCDENGNPMININTENEIVKFGLLKAFEQKINEGVEL